MYLRNLLPFIPLLAPAVGEKVSYAGVNLFGFAADVSILGSAYSLFMGTNCNASYDAYPFVDPPDHYYDWHDLGFNLFRLPLTWQHAQTKLSGPLNETTMGHIDALVDTITKNGSTAIIDIHNYARWYCSIIGQPENSILNPNVTVTDEDFVDLWSRLADRYKSNDNVIFELMNEPHDLNMTKWTQSASKAISAIRTIAPNHRILVPGTQFARLTDWTSFSLPALSTIPTLLSQLNASSVAAPIKPTSNLIYDFHQYFDDDGGAYGVCEPWSAYAPRFDEVTGFLRQSGAQGMLTEFGGGPVPPCVALFEELLAYLERNRDVWLGWTAWGSFNVGSPLELSLDEKSPFYTLTEVLGRFAPLEK